MAMNSTTGTNYSSSYRDKTATSTQDRSTASASSSISSRRPSTTSTSTSSSTSGKIATPATSLPVKSDRNVGITYRDRLYETDCWSGSMGSSYGSFMRSLHTRAS
ncbi:hypothetical protein LTR84_003306 [Exophiala bonariae]|uniref:REJ domain-containing protein n=1 Tax=Exophiala bonariae TaxID=1690606 RepID=A0AAV9NAA4_9EURO|nr:hypothetical protein LTR84_003306 [Exophiala bonariae]